MGGVESELVCADEFVCCVVACVVVLFVVVVERCGAVDAVASLFVVYYDLEAVVRGGPCFIGAFLFVFVCLCLVAAVVLCVVVSVVAVVFCLHNIRTQSNKEPYTGFPRTACQ